MDDTNVCSCWSPDMWSAKKKRISSDQGFVLFQSFFEETHLEVPKEKQNLYVAHEIVQMRPLIVKNDMYHRFLVANQWVTSFFPNLKKKESALCSGFTRDLPYKNISKEYKTNTNYIGSIIEFLCKKIQLFIMKRHRTRERITATQLWFFPRDFEKRLRRKKMI